MYSSVKDNKDAKAFNKIKKKLNKIYSNILQALEENQVSTVFDLIQKLKKEPYAQISPSKTETILANKALFCAIKSYDQDMISFLLNSGIKFDFNCIENKYFSCTFLHWAIRKNNLNVVNLLLNAEAAQNMDIFNKERNNTGKWHSALKWATFVGNKEIISRLLKEISPDCSEAILKHFKNEWTHASGFLDKLKILEDEFNALQKLNTIEQDKLHADLSLSFSDLEIGESLAHIPTELPYKIGGSDQQNEPYSITENAKKLRFSPKAAEFKPFFTHKDNKENFCMDDNPQVGSPEFFPSNEANSRPTLPYRPVVRLLPPPFYYYSPVFIPSYPVILTPAYPRVFVAVPHPPLHESHFENSTSRRI